MIYSRPSSAVLWCQYHVDGARVRKSTGETDITEARKFLQRELAEVATGKKHPRQDRVTVAQLVDAKLQDKRNRGDKSTSDEERRWRLHLQRYFGNMKAPKVTTLTLNAFVSKRQKETDIYGKKPSPAEINRELAFLRSAFYFGLEKVTPPLVVMVPNFPHLKESKPRQGFLKDDEYVRLASSTAKIGLWMRTAFELACMYGWRKDEVLTLRVNQYDPEDRTLSLPDSKNGDPRLIPLTPKCVELLNACIVNKQPNDFILTREDGSHIADMRNSWWNATEKAGVPNLLFHDLRRTGAREMRKLKLDESVIMKFGGWRTPSMFRRYNIVDKADMEEGAQKIAQRQRKLKEIAEKSSNSEFSHNLATTTPSSKSPKPHVQ